MRRLNELTVAAKANGLELDESVLEKALNFAELSHTDQKRLSGEAYVNHPIEVAKILIQWKLDQTSVIAGLLHDTVEDGGATRDDIVKDFGDEVALLVDGVTKVSHLRLRGSKELDFVENLRKMFLSMAQDLRVVLVKLADRLHNMRTLESLPPEKQEKIARETLEVYAPLAERLGMGEVKAELEDLAFPYAYPEEYRRVYSEAKLHYKTTSEHIKKMKRSLLRALTGEGLHPKVQVREKHLYSLWKKLTRPEIAWDFEHVHDIVAMRIIVNEISDCYHTLGIVHSLYKPVPHLGVSDYIAQPKPNGYRSIHTKVFGPGKRIVEVQIRTREMHEQAEYGVAAHWAYSEAKSKGAKDEVLDKQGVSAPGRLSWVRQLADWQKELADSKEFLEAVKFDAFSQRNFVFSPNGDVFDLPSGATPVDFAFAVHTDLGQYIKSAKVNGRIVPLSYRLKSGEVVEIIKAKNSKKPNRGWLDFTVTTAARRHIRRELGLTEK